MPNRNCFAFYDVDETLIRTNSMFDFYRFFCSWRGREEDFPPFRDDFAEMRRLNCPREQQNAAYYRYFAGTSRKELTKAGKLWWQSVLGRPKIFIESTLGMLRNLQDEGVTPVFVSGSFKEILAPIGGPLGVQHYLCAPMNVGPDGIYDGELGFPQTIGKGKAEAVTAFLQKYGGDASNCWAFGDDLSDVPMLETIGRPTAVGWGTPLATLARGRGWAVLESGTTL